MHLREFTVTLPVPVAEVVTALRARGIEPGVVVGEHRLLVCVTELVSQSDIDILAGALAAVVAPELAEEQK